MRASAVCGTRVCPSMCVCGTALCGGGRATELSGGQSCGRERERERERESFRGHAASLRALIRGGGMCDVCARARYASLAQLGDWERPDDAKAVHRKLSPNCPLVLGMQCGNIPRSEKVPPPPCRTMHSVLLHLRAPAAPVPLAGLRRDLEPLSSQASGPLAV